MYLDLCMFVDRVFMRFFLDLLYLMFMYVVYPYFIYTSLPSLFSCVCCTIPIVILIPIVYLEMCRLSREVSALLYMYSYA
jgi:hypothetical protein